MREGKPYRFHPEASKEFEAADDWYFLRSPDASVNFLSEVESGIVRITQAPHTGPSICTGRDGTSCDGSLSPSFILTIPTS